MDQERLYEALKKLVPHAMVLYFGTPPELVRLDTAGRPQARLGPAPVAVFQAQLSPSGRYAALWAHNSGSWHDYAVFVSDLHTGALWHTPADQDAGMGPTWLPGDRLLVAAAHRLWLLDPATQHATLQPSRGNAWGALSPDGRYLAGSTGGQPGRGTGAWIGPNPAGELVIHDVQKGSEVAYPWEGVAWRGPFWLPDGGLVIGVTPEVTERKPNPPVDYFRVALDTGHRVPWSGPTPWDRPAPYKPFTGPNGQPLRLSPDLRPLPKFPDGSLLALRWTNLAGERPPGP